MESTTIPTTTPPHIALLRDETLVLRWLFGYYNRPAPIPHSMSPLLSTRPQQAGIKDVRLLGIDIDALQQSEEVIQQFHIGVSILDTSWLQPLVGGTSMAKPISQTIESHRFVVGSSKFSRKKSNKFLFGRFETISLSALKVKLGILTSRHDVILVFHGGDREVDILRRLDIDLHPLYIIDTVKAAQYPLQLSYRYSLEKLLEELGIPFINLHTAGNDAHFVLRALLMIVVRDAERELDASALPAWLSTVSAIAQAPRPPTKAEIVDSSQMT